MMTRHTTILWIATVASCAMASARSFGQTVAAPWHSGAVLPEATIPHTRHSVEPPFRGSRSRVSAPGGDRRRTAEEKRLNPTGIQPLPLEAPGAATPRPKAPPGLGYVSRLGICTERFSMATPFGTVRGAAVIHDHHGRALYRMDVYSQWQRYRFRVRYDVILQVNGARVESGAEVLRTLQLGWNDLRIWDRYTGRTATYRVRLY